MQVKIKSAEFRKAHMEVKNFLFTQTDMKELSRGKTFPIYTRELNLLKIDRELRKGRDKMSEMSFNQLTQDKSRLKQMKPVHGILFQNYLSALVSGKQEMVSDVLDLVEANYLPRVNDD